ncbi:MAG: hypothetical protein RMJ53_09260 [Chitinophagales bacterium]|nr:hypothetical protein [Chitinophagales bacterium]MDW8274402.1 hypothetical protein [Chitinophagales bacterium]
MIKFSPFSPIVGQLPISGELRCVYERFVTHNNSVTIGGSFNYLNLAYRLLVFLVDTAVRGRINLIGGRVQAGYRIYPLSGFKAPEGFWFGPTISYNYARLYIVRSNGSTLDYHLFNTGMLAGYQLNFQKHWYFEAFGGLGYKNNIGIYTDGLSGRKERYNIGFPPLPVLRHIKIYLAVHFGYAF